MNRSAILAVFTIVMLASLAHGDVAMIDVTQESQSRDKINWITISVTNHLGQDDMLTYTATLQKDVASRLIASNTADGFVSGAKVQYTDEKDKVLLSVPVMIQTQKDGSGLLTFSTTLPATKRCSQEVTFAENISEGGPLVVTLYSFKLATYLTEKRTNVPNKTQEGIGEELATPSE